ncbi:MAG: aminoglycoside phosphotransferase family protein, partial [Calditrichaeota bacterium]
LFSRPVDGQTSWWFSGKLLRPRVAHRHFAQAKQTTPSGNGWAPALFFLDALRMIVWRFPYEEAMPGLRFFEQPERLHQFFSEKLFPAFPAPDGLAWQGYRPIKYMPGKRCVLQHTFLNKRTGDTVQLYSKTYPDGQAEEAFDRWQEVARRMKGVMETPLPLAYWQEACTIWMEAWPGEPLLDSPTGLNETLFARLGRQIAGLHQLPAGNLEPLILLEDVLASAREDCASLAWHLPEHTSLFQQIGRRIELLCSGIEVGQIPRALVHNALRLEQFLGNGERIALLDLDAAGQGDPLYDVAEFLSSLEYLALCQPEYRQLLAFQSAFLEAYANQVPWEMDARRLLAYQLTALAGKLHDSIKNLHRPALNRLEEILNMLDTLNRQAGRLCGD